MKLTSEEALNLVESFRPKFEDDRWIDHSICVGNSAGRMAKAMELDEDKAKALGFVHDIGKGVGPFKDHVMNGYRYLKELGVDDEFANICLTHSYLNNDIYCTAGGIPEDIPFRTKFIKNHEYTIYEKIINLCDLMCTNVIMTVEKRLIDIMTRRGVYKNTQYHLTETFRLKSFIDEKLGFNVYNLFPEIKDNL